MKKMENIAIIKKMVEKAIDTGDYSFIRKAMDMAGDEGIFMAEDNDFVMIEDDVFYFNGAF